MKYLIIIVSVFLMLFKANFAFPYGEGAPYDFGNLELGNKVTDANDVYETKQDFEIETKLIGSSMSDFHGLIYIHNAIKNKNLALTYFDDKIYINHEPNDSWKIWETDKTKASYLTDGAEHTIKLRVTTSFKIHDYTNDKVSASVKVSLNIDGVDLDTFEYISGEKDYVSDFSDSWKSEKLKKISDIEHANRVFLDTGKYSTKAGERIYQSEFGGNLYLNGKWPGGTYDASKNHMDFYQIKVTDYTKTPNAVKSLNPDAKIKVSFDLSGSTSPLPDTAVGAPSLGDRSLRWNSVIDYSDLKTQVTLDGNENTRYKLMSISGKNLPANVAQSGDEHSGLNTLSVNKFNLTQDSEIVFKWKKQYRLKLANVGAVPNTNPVINILDSSGKTVKTYTGPQDIIWVSEGNAVKINTPQKVDQLNLFKYVFKDKDTIVTASTPTDGDNYVISLVASMSDSTYGEIKLVYDNKKYSLKTTVEIPRKVDGSPAFSNKYGQISNIDDGQTEASVSLNAGSEVDSSVKGLVFDPNNANVRYKLASIVGTGSAKNITKSYTANDSSYQFDKFNLLEDSSVKYTWKAQHRLKINTSRTAANSLPVVLVNGSPATLSDTRKLIINSSSNGKIVAPKQDLAISFNFKGSKFFTGDEVLFSLGDTVDQHENIYLYYSLATGELRLAQTKGTSWDKIAAWKLTEAQKGLFSDGTSHKVIITFKIDSGVMASYLKFDGGTEVKSGSHSFLEKSFIGTGISANLKGDLTVGAKGDFITQYNDPAYTGEITDLTFYNHLNTKIEPYVIANRTVIAVASGTGEYWIEDGAKVQLLIPASGIDNLIVQGFSLTVGTGGLAQSLPMTSMTYNGASYYQVALTDSSGMNISNAGTVNWDFGTKVHAFDAVLGQAFTLDKALPSSLSINSTLKTTEQVSEKMLKGIQAASHKPTLFAPVENTPANSNVINGMIFTSRNASTDVAKLGRDLYKGQIYFTRPGVYRMEWLLGGADFPIEGDQGISKLVVEVNVKWPDTIDYQHIAETPDIPLDVSATDNLAYKELRLVQRLYTQGGQLVSDTAEVTDITVSSDKKFSFPEWKGTNYDEVYRSVLFFTRSLDATRAATGSLAEEEVVVKVVESKHWRNGVKDEKVVIGEEITNTGHDPKVLHNGYVLKNKLEKARYNITTYNSESLKGQIFAVNMEAGSDKYSTDGNDDLVVAWYKNHSEGTLNWPYKAVRYIPEWPEVTSVDRIVVASRLGSDGLKTTESTSRQLKFDPARYENLAVYNQPNINIAGYNPNEEHALVKPSYFYGTETPRPSAAYALRNDLNLSDNTQTDSGGYTSAPFVLVQYQDKQTKVYGESKYAMKLYRIETQDEKTTDTHISYKMDTNKDGVLDAKDANSNGSFKYVFDYPMYAGDKVVAPYPLNEVIGASSINEISGDNPPGHSVYWEDKDGNGWVVAGDSYYEGRFWYPMQSAFWHPAAKTGDVIPFAESSKADNTAKVFSKYGSDYFVSNGIPEESITFPGVTKVKFTTYWKAGIPEIRIGETLTFEGGEEKKDNPSANGLPSAVAWASAEILYDGLNASALSGDWSNADKTSVRIHPVVREIKVDLGSFPGDLEKDNVSGKYFLKGLHAGLKNRIYYDESSKKLVLRGILNDRFAGDSQLTKSPGGYNYALQPNVLTQEDLTTFFDAVKSSTEKVSNTADPDNGKLKRVLLESAFIQLYALSLDPTLQAEDLAGLVYNSSTATVKVGKKAVENRIGLSYFLRDKNNRLLVMTPPNFANAAKVKALLPNGRFPNGIDLLRLEQVAVDLNSSENKLPHGMTIEDSVTREAINAGGRLVRIKDGQGYIPGSQLGTGLALTTNPNLMQRVSETGFGSYVVVAENNSPSIKGSPIQLHILKVNNRPFRGQIKTIFSDNVFDEKIALRHTGDFGGDSSDLVFEWRYRETDTTKPDTPPSPITADPSCPSVTAQPSSLSSATDWNVFADDRLPKPEINGQGRNEVIFGKTAGKDVLVDNSFFVRYRHKDSQNWSGWAGAGNNLPCNKPTASYASQLVKGWVKRVTDNVNQYDARISNFSTSGAPATYVSMIEQAGTAYVGDVALNADKNVIENTGLIALYQTVLNRAKNLSISSAQPAFTQGVGIALLNAASRISQFYTLLGNEAYSDSLDPTIGFTTDSRLSEYGSLAPTIFTFQNQVASLAEEELALLRGRAELGGAPSHNRLLWNFTNNDGEAAYALSYDIKDKNDDGFINEKDAKIMFPQGHGDAWGHYLSAVRGYYTLMRHKDFSWVPRSEKYEIDGITLDVDYLDERRFAEAAAAKAKVGSEIVSLTYRQMYEEDPDGQWQGYKDTDSAKSWGVDGWLRRVHQGAYFDWVVAHSMLPASDTKNTGVQQIDRTTVPELQEISVNGNQVLMQLAEINNGQNPLGLLPEVVPFDIEPGTDETQFEQVYARAEKALTNATNVFDYANNLKNRIRKVADTQQEFSEQVYIQDREYRNRLIELFGTPYEGVIGAGKAYPEGYDGPDLHYYQYIDVGEISDKTLTPSHDSFKAYPKKFGNTAYQAKEGEGLVTAFHEYYKGDFPDGFSSNLDQIEIKDLGVKIVEYPLSKGNYSMTAPSYWGKRSSPGQLQAALTEILKADIDLRLAGKAYGGLAADLQRLERTVKAKNDLAGRVLEIKTTQAAANKAVSVALLGVKSIQATTDAAISTATKMADSIIEGTPKVVGTSNDPGAALRATVKTNSAAIIGGLESTRRVADVSEFVLETTKEVHDFGADLLTDKAEYDFEIKQYLLEMDNLLDSEPEFRMKLFKAREVVRQATEKYRSILGKGQRLMEERGAFNKKVAAKTHGKRYQDMAFRLNRTEASQKYRAAFDLAAKYAYLAAKAYDYETNLSPKHSASAQHVLKEIVQARTLGQVEDGEPVVGQGGLADTLGRLKANFSVLKTQMGFNNPQLATEPFSMRSENFRVKDDKKKWQKALGKHYTANIWDIPEFRTQMRSFAAESSGKQPGLVIPFSTEITSGKNFFGFPLAANDHAYDPSQFSTRIQSVGIWLEGYKDLGLAETARAYLVPVGQDVMYVPDSVDLDTREWNVRDQKIPAPLPFGKSDMESASWTPMQAMDGPEGQVRRHSQLRVYHDSGEVDQSKIQSDSRLFGRSVWNNRWLLVIPGAALLADSEEGIQRLINGKPVPGQTTQRDGNGISDIKLIFKTYAYSGN